MTMTSSQRSCVSVCLAISLVAASSSTASAGTRIGAGAAVFDAPSSFDSNSKGVEFTAAFDLRPWLAIDAGVLHQEGEKRYPVIPGRFTEYEWRAVYAGPRFVRSLGERWQVHAGVALAHVALEREQPTTFTSPDGAYEVIEGGRYDSGTWGALARLGVGFDLTPRQQVSLDYRRLHAGLDHTCEYDDDLGGFARCGLVRYGSTDGVSLTWSLRFD